MAQREFDITIDPSGKVELHVKGFKGRSCMDVVKLFEEMIGEKETLHQTSEFYEPEEQVRFNIDQRT